MFFYERCLLSSKHTNSYDWELIKMNGYVKRLHVICHMKTCLRGIERYLSKNILLRRKVALSGTTKVSKGEKKGENKVSKVCSSIHILLSQRFQGKFFWNWITSRVWNFLQMKRMNKLIWSLFLPVEIILVCSWSVSVDLFRRMQKLLFRK